MMKKWLLLRNMPISRLECKNHTPFMTKMAKNWLKSIPYLWPKRLKNHTLWGRTYLYSPYKGVPHPGSSLGGSVLKREKKEAVSSSRENFPFCGTILAPRCIFKRIARRILSTPAHSEIVNIFPVEMYFDLSAVITDWNFEINSTNTARIWTCGLCRFFAVTRFFVPH